MTEGSSSFAPSSSPKPSSSSSPSPSSPSPSSPSPSSPSPSSYAPSSSPKPSPSSSPSPSSPSPSSPSPSSPSPSSYAPSSSPKPSPSSSPSPSSPSPSSPSPSSPSPSSPSPSSPSPSSPSPSSFAPSSSPKPSSSPSPSSSSSDECEGNFEASVDLEIEEQSETDTEFGGRTSYEPDPPTVTTEVQCDAANRVWKARVSDATFTVTTTIGVIYNVLNEGVIEGSGCPVLRQMAEDLAYTMNNAGRSDPDREDYWLPQGFIEAHEAVHNRHLRAALAAAYAQLVQDIEQITRPCSDYTSSEAAADMQDDIDDAIEAFQGTMREFYENEVEHNPPGDFIAAHTAFLTPWAALVDTEAENQGCFP
jgi:hypothetical protein